MKTLSRTLAMIISLQLAVGCNGEMFAINQTTVLPGASDSISIEGSISRTFNTLSNLILPSAMAQDGKIQVYDITSPDEELLLHEEEIEGTSYSVVLKRSEVDGKLLKVKYESYADEALSRSLLLEASPVDNKIEASIDEDKSIQSNIAEARLKRDLGNGVIDKSQVKERLAEIKSNFTEDSYNIVDDKDLMLKLFRNSKVVQAASEIVAGYNASEDENEKRQLRRKLMYISYKNEIIEQLPRLNCSDKSQSLFVPDIGVSYSIKISAVDKPSTKIASPGLQEIASVTNFEESDQIFHEVMEKLRVTSQEDNVNYGLNVVVESEKGEKVSCVAYGLKNISTEASKPDEGAAPSPYEYDKRILDSHDFTELASYEENEKRLYDLFMKTIEDFEYRLSQAKIEKGSEEWNLVYDQQYVLAKKHYLTRIDELKYYVENGGSKSVAAKAETAKKAAEM